MRPCLKRLGLPLRYRKGEIIALFEENKNTTVWDLSKVVLTAICLNEVRRVKKKVFLEEKGS